MASTSAICEKGNEDWRAAWSVGFVGWPQGEVLLRSIYGTSDVPSGPRLWGFDLQYTGAPRTRVETEF
jgi:hypothetical protein